MNIFHYLIVLIALLKSLFKKVVFSTNHKYIGLNLELALNPYLRFILSISVYLLFVFVFNFNVVHAMKPEDHNNILQIITQYKDDREARMAAILNYLTELTDQDRISAIRNYIDNYARVHGLQQVPFTDTQTLNIATAGRIPEQEPLTWSQIFQRAILFIGLSALLYAIWRYGDSIREFISDLSQRTLTPDNLNILIARTRYYFQNTTPEQRDLLVDGLSEFIRRSYVEE